MNDSQLVGAVFQSKLGAKFNQHTVGVILEAKRQGATKIGAAKFAGISRVTLDEWLKKAESPEADPYGVYKAFADSYYAAEEEHARESAAALIERLRQPRTSTAPAAA